jgi:hypothetical protein
MGTPPEHSDQQTPTGGWGMAVTIAVVVVALNLALAPWTTPREFATSSGLNVSTGGWVDLVALERRSP